MVKKFQDLLKQKFIKSNTKEGGGSIKIFGDDLNPSIPCKTFLLSIKDTAEWIVKEMLEKYGLKHEDSQNYCLLQIIIPRREQIGNTTIKETILHDKECPLNIYLHHLRKNQGSIIFKVIKCPQEYVEIRKQLRTQEKNLDITKIPSIQYRTIDDQFPMFIEINHDGTDLLTPRVFKLYLNTTYVGRNAKSAIGKQYFYIDGIDRDHCTIENQNGTVSLVPHGEIWLNGKPVSKPFILQHGAVIRFGRNATFCYCDPQFIQKSNLISEHRKSQNVDKLFVYGSLPILPMTGVNKMNNFQSSVLHIQPKKTSSTNIIEQGPKFNVLPGLLEVPVETEIRFLHAVFNNYPLNNIHFRLSPVYTLYMALRHRLSPYGKSSVSFMQRLEGVVSLLHCIEDMINKKIEECQEHGGYLAYWLANTSEFVYFLKHDRDLSKISHDIQIRLIESIQRLFYYLINCLKNELDKYLIAFTNPQDDNEHDIHIILNNPKVLEENNLTNLKFSDIRWITIDRNTNQYHQSTLNDILATFSSIMNLLRKCRVNVALTIQIFSQIFHYINTWLFNRIVCCPDLKLCSYVWGEKLLFRLKSIHNWAEKQGLELASECHLIKVNQLCQLLKSSKSDVHDVQQLLLNKTFKINSIQITQILNNYILSKKEPSISNSFREALLSIAYKHVDENLHREGFTIQLAEEPSLTLPFLFPEDGYTCENLRGIPEKLFEFIEPMSRSALCRLFTNSYSFGLWTEFMQASIIENNNNENDRIETIILNKKGNNLGLSIVSAKSVSQPYQGIYIKSIIPGSVAEDDGRLQPGDQILCVDEIALIDKTPEQAAEALKRCGPSVILQIRKDAANHHGLGTLLTPPSDNHHEFTRLYSASNPSLLSDQYPHSALTLQTTNSHERLSTAQQHFTTRIQHDQLNPSVGQPCIKKVSFSHEITNHQQQSIPSSDLTSNDQTNSHISQQYLSNPYLFNSKQKNEQILDNYRNSFQLTDFIRSHNQTQSLTNQNMSSVKSLVFREDMPLNQNQNHRIKSTIPPKTLPKPIINNLVLIKQRSSTNDVDISNSLSKPNLSISSDHSTSSIGKFEIEQQELSKVANTNQNNINEIRLKRMNDLITKLNRTEQEEKELNNLKLDNEFDCCVEEFYSQINKNNNQETYSQLQNCTDEMNHFDEKLKRRLEQFDQERQIERAHINQMFTKNKLDTEARLRKEREREIRADHEMQEFKTRRMSEDERMLEAKREQARLLKHIRFPNSRIKDDQLSNIDENEHIITEFDSNNKNSFLQRSSSIFDEQETYIDPC
ncbi:unnamed protein product [Rotaria sp. Silwood1]|nr:unnamed protein product [Rotaria sp. Silwood1]CAF0907861.1 unnamed protein product [Rotaria sp. Silwood1]CAF4704663.1 unnamed protein product [Rotaria sp. Silwood1]